LGRLRAQEGKKKRRKNRTRIYREEKSGRAYRSVNSTVLGQGDASTACMCTCPEGAGGLAGRPAGRSVDQTSWGAARGPLAPTQGREGLNRDGEGQRCRAGQGVQAEQAGG